MALREAVRLSYSADYQFIVFVDCVEDDGTTETTLPFSDRPFLQKGYIPDPTWNYVYFEPRVQSVLNITESMYGLGNAGGVVSPSTGSIVLANGDGGLDYLADYYFDNKAVEILIGQPGETVVDGFFSIFRGVILSVGFDEQTVTLEVSDLKEKLNKVFPPNDFTSGNASGSPKPIVLGQVFNVEPVLTNETTHIYQVHDGAITSIDAVYEAGELLTGGGTDYTANLAKGTIQLTSAPSGVITVDATNDIVYGSFTNRAGGILYELAVEYAGLEPTTNPEVYGGGFFGPPSLTSVGGYFRDRITVLDAMNQFLVSIGASMVGKIENNNAIYPLVFEYPPTSGTPTIAEYITDNDIIEIEMLPTIPPAWSVAVNYKRNYRPLTQAELGASPADADYAVRKYLSVTDGGDKSATIYSSRDVFTVDSLITNVTDATTEAARLADEIYEKTHKVFRIKMKGSPLSFGLGDIIAVTCSRFGIGSERWMVIISKIIDLEANEITVEATF